MNDSQISVRYAKALFKSALDQDLIDKVNGDMALLLELCNVNEYNFMLETPAFSSDQKCNMTMEILKDRTCKLVNSLVRLVMENRRENFIPGIARNYMAIYKKHRGIKTASLVTATTTDDKTKSKLKDIVKKVLKADVDLTSSVDESLLGGFILTIEDQQYDASVANNLKKIRKQLLDTSVIKN